MNLGDPELELIDPTPNVHSLFIHFDKTFFWTKLASRAVVRWSKRMYSCAGICSYEGRGGLCDIALSEPLLKLRPRKDLIETLLHEMIHAYLFITCRDRERDGHGPNFKAHMHRINKSAGLNISIYHDFHDEVKLYQTHWWRCNGPCQTRKPYFGIVRRSQNRAPGPSDYWWSCHQKTCGGTFVKIKEPDQKKKTCSKPKGDIRKYINNNNNTKDNNIKTIDDLPKNDRKPLTPIQKTSNIPVNTIKTNSGSTVPVTQKGVELKPVNTKLPAPPFTGKGHSVNGSRKRSNSVDVAEKVRDIWSKKFEVSDNNTVKGKELVRNNTTAGRISTNKSNKPVVSPAHVSPPPAKIKKIDEYFKTTATNVLKDLYGQDFKITERNKDKKVVAVIVNKVNCPICNSKVDSNEINRHLDECLNRDLITELTQTNTENNTQYKKTEQELKKHDVNTNPSKLRKTIGDIKEHTNSRNNHCSSNVSIDLSNINFGHTTLIKKVGIIKDEKIDLTFDAVDVNKVKSIVKKIQFDKHSRKSDNFVVPKEEPKDVEVGFLPSFLDDIATDMKVPSIKTEPGTSKDIVSPLTIHKCPCCDEEVSKPIAQHLDECLSFFDNNTTIPEEGASTSFANNTIVIDDDDDDEFDETMTMNATGTKTPCPCCMIMVEADDMNSHLDECLS